MKSVDSSPADREGMTNKSIVTCAGDWNLFCTLEAPLVAAIPQDSCEWRRSYGRATKSVYLEAQFIKYNNEKTQSEVNLLKRPILHVYWTDCVDIEYYKTTLREEVELWLKQLEKAGITDWMIVQVETYDIRKTNKLLPRTTVLDKIKGDFAIKQNEDRFISVINPIKSEARSAESWRALVAKMRHFILVAYNKALIKFEEYMREQREKRNDPDWDFCKYFLLQEQLAFVLEMLGLYDEALVQYDELDALFSQFVLNSNITESPKWLDTFKQPVTSWQAVRLTALVPQRLRELIIKKKASLLDFRSYLFQRQSAMLLLTCKPWEIASRCLSTVHSTALELRVICSACCVSGAAACWAVLACAETLQACERLAAATPTALEMCAKAHAPLLHHAKDKLHELGKLCGLLPGSPPPSSEQLHLVVMLSAGMGDSEPASARPTPTDRLKEALCSAESFQQYYLELAELAMGTYKHIGRLRFARLIGRDLAAFYSELGETSKAVVFLMDALRSYEEQGWKELAAQTRLELVAAAKKMNDMDRYTKLSATIASTSELEILVRNFYYEEMMKIIREELSKKPETVLSELNECFKIVSVALLPSERGLYITDNKVQCRMVVESNLPKDVVCTKAAISIEVCNRTEKRTPVKHKTDLTVSGSVGTQTSSPKKVTEETDTTTIISSIRLDDLKPKNPLLNPLQITSQLHYKEDKTLQKVTVECHNPKVTLRRSDSSKYRKPSATTRNDYQNCFSIENFTIKPGVNDIFLEFTGKQCGTYKLGQISLLVEEKLEFLSNVLVGGKVGFEVVTQGVNVYLNKVEPKKDLVAGLEHAMELVVTSGSLRIEENATIQLKSSSGLLIRLTQESPAVMSREATVWVPPCPPFSTTSVPLTLFASLQPRREKTVEHTVWLTCPWWENVTEVPLHFSPPMIASWRLLTSNTRKFIHVTLKSTVAHLIQFVLIEPKLECDGNNTVSDLNPKKGENMIVASDGTTASFMWELLKDPLVRAGPMKATFTVQYRMVNGIEPARTFTCPFDIQDYTTLFVIRTKLEPSKGSDFCRASQMCCLQLNVQRVNETEYTSLMYEVLADQSMWAVLGRTAGVITMESTSTEPQNVTLDVMPLVAGYLPLPTVRLSKYIAANTKDPKKDISAHPRLEPFSPGQVYHAGKARQVHVLPPAPKEHIDQLIN